MSLVTTLMQGAANAGYVNTAAIQEGFGNITDDFLTEAVVALTNDIYKVEEAYFTADIIGSCKVVTEGASADVIMESMVSSGVEKLKAAWTKFLAAIKSFFDKVITFFKSMMMSGSKFVSTYQAQLKEKAKTAKEFKYNGYDYNRSAGDAAADKAKKAIAAKINEFMGGFSYVDAANTNTDDLLEKLHLGKGDSKKTASDVAEELVKSIDSSCSSSSELKAAIVKAYRNDADSKSKQTLGGASDITAMCSWVSKAGDAIKKVKSDKADFESKVTAIIKKMDTLGNKKGTNKTEQAKYTMASTISSYMSVIMNLYKAPCDATITAYKEMNRVYTNVLKMFLNFGKAKKVGEGVSLFEGEDVDDIDLDDNDLDVEESATDGADNLEGDEDDIGIVKENCGGKGGKDNEPEGDDDLLEEAMSFLY